MQNTVQFDDPPLVEMIFGVQFSPIVNLAVSHMVWFCELFGDEWLDPSDGMAHPDRFESFGRPNSGDVRRGLGWKADMASRMSRISLRHRRLNRLIEFQSTQLRMHWKRSQDEYPGYFALAEEFGGVFSKLVALVKEYDLGEILLNQWELTYINSFPRPRYWRQPQDWAGFLPGLFGTPLVAEGLVMDSRSANWSYLIEPEQGRLHVSAQSRALPGEVDETLLLRTTARGPTGRKETQYPRKEFDVGHDAILKTFLQVTSDEVRSSWGNSR